MFVTLFLCVLNIETGEMRFTNAGHNPPVLKHDSGEIQLLSDIHGPVVGAMEDFQYNQASIFLMPGDQVILYTDGVTEAMDIENKLYSDDRLYDFIKNTPFDTSEELVSGIVKSVVHYREEAEQSDDITILSIKYDPKDV